MMRTARITVSPLHARNSILHRTLQLPMQAGVALITSLLFLIMLTLLALPLMRGFGLEEKIAGNTREKERAFQSAENALGYSEWWLVDRQATDGIDCTNPPALGPNEIRVCSLKTPIPADPDTWQNQGGTQYSPPQWAAGATGGGGTAIDAFNNADINYARVPGLYVAYLGASSDNAETFYSITSAGYGGGSDTAAVTQSVFKLYYASKSLNGP